MEFDAGGPSVSARAATHASTLQLQQDVSEDQPQAGARIGVVSACAGLGSMGNPQLHDTTVLFARRCHGNRGIATGSSDGLPEQMLECLDRRTTFTGQVAGRRDE